MGLDMYLTGNKYFHRFDQNLNRLPSEKEDGYEVKSHNLSLGYWRKHPNLHGYIVETFADGADECQEIELSAADIRQILQAITDNALPSTEGFFFGESDGTEKLEDIQIFADALKWLEQQDQVSWRSVIYQASW
jgi:hypothetical protein